MNRVRTILNAVDAMTSRWLDAAGIGEGMRVLDIGCGPGVVTAELAARVGPRDTVYAVDREPRMLELCRKRVRALGQSNVEFVQGTFDATGTPELVDVACGLHGVLQAAGLSLEGLHAEANLLTPHSQYPIGDIVRAVQPRLTEAGIVTAGEVDVETLDARLAQERRRVGATSVWELVFCAWARTRSGST